MSHRRHPSQTMLGHAPRRATLRTPSARPHSVPEPPSRLSPEEVRRQRELEQELQLARDIQQGLLLEAVPHLPGWEMTAISIPARDLGGDLYDFLPARGGRQGIMIGDVSGKGLPAALRMAVARTVFRHEARRGEPPALTMAAVNRSVLTEIPHGMVTMLYALLDPRRGTLVLANAGHNYPILVNGRIEEIELSGLPLGVDLESDYDEASTVIPYGASILLYTDGVTEANNAEGEMFGYERLEALMRDNSALKPRALVACLLHELRAWSTGNQDDDITVVAIRRRLISLTDELCSVADDVLGSARAQQLWATLPASPAVDVEEWAARLPDLIKNAQATFGRGLARELQQQFRLVVDEYRTF